VAPFFTIHRDDRAALSDRGHNVAMAPRRDEPPPRQRGVGKVVTGGQTGVDRAATDVARELGIPYGGFVPRGGWAEDTPTPPGVLAEYPSFVELAADDPAVRTARNVAAADAVLVLVRSHTNSPGTELAIRCAREQGKHLGLVDLSSPTHRERLEAIVAKLPPRCTLNVVGPRESEQPGTYDAVTTFLLAHRSVLFEV